MSTLSSVCAVRPAAFDDLEEVAILLHRIFGVRQSAAVLRWKYGGPAGRMVGSTVLLSNRRIVGFLGQIPTRVCMEGREMTAVQGADIGILEEYRRLDAFLTLVRASVSTLEEAGIALTCGTANADAALTLAALLGQPRVAAVPLLVRPFGCTVPAQTLSAAAWIARLVTRCRATYACTDPRLIQVDRFDDRFNQFWRRIRNDYPILFVRDAAFLNWRYVDAPGTAYQRLGIENAESGRIEGYAVLGLERRGDKVRGRVCDLVTPRRAGHRAAHTLITAAVEWLRAQEAEIADVWMFPHAHLRFALRLHGFMPRRPGHGGFQVSALGAGKKANQSVAEHPGNWFLSLGDSDTV